MKLIAVVTDVPIEDKELFEPVEKFFRLIQTKHKSAIYGIDYKDVDGQHTIFYIYVMKCKNSVWKAIIKALDEAKKFFVIEYKTFD